MAKAQPIKDLKNIEQMKQYFRDKKEWRNYALFIFLYAGGCLWGY